MARGPGPARLTRTDAAVLAAFVLSALLALVWLPAFPVVLRLLAAAGIGLLVAVGVGAVAYREMRDEEQ